MNLSLPRCFLQVVAIAGLLFSAAPASVAAEAAKVFFDGSLTGEVVKADTAKGKNMQLKITSSEPAREDLVGRTVRIRAAQPTAGQPDAEQAAAIKALTPGMKVTVSVSATKDGALLKLAGIPSAAP